MGITKRKYKNYKEYIYHQSLKLKIGLRKKIKKFTKPHFNGDVESFISRISTTKKYIKDGDILCLGARLGAEVVAFRKLGYSNTIGIDINPGLDNSYVIKGDFHNMPFEDNKFDTIYCNCIDHVWDFRTISIELNRVLKLNGRLILEIDHFLKQSKKKRKEWVNRDSKYESIVFDNLKDLEKQFKEFKKIDKFKSSNSNFIFMIFDNK